MDQKLIVCSEDLINQTLDAATTVHKILGPGLFESIYERALGIELTKQGISYKSQVKINATYKGENLGPGFRADIIIENSLILEIKSIQSIGNIHLSQVITYLRLLNYKRGFILNFNQTRMKDGIKRISI